MILTDTHAHLYAKEFDNDRDDILKRAIASGVHRFFLPNMDSTSIPGMLELSGKFPENCFPMMGLHPCSVNLTYESELKLIGSYLERKDQKFYAIGEIGLDFYWDKQFAVQQIAVFRSQIELALEFKLPIVIHVRKAFKETIEITKEYTEKGLRGIFHCFSGSLEEANQIISLKQFKLGIGGVVTFKNGGLSEVVSEIPLEFIVLETDAPYLAPVPYRGKRNESSYLLLIAKKIAELKKCSLEEVAKQTTDNSIDIFGR